MTTATVSPIELSLEEIAALEHTYHGPTWRKREDGKWDLPAKTLGWQIAGWCAEYLLGEDGQPWRFTKEQLRFVLWWYAVDDSGRFVYRKGVLQRLKGWGKDPLLAVLCMVEFVGPSRPKLTEFGELFLDDNGDPVGVPHPQAWVQVAAVSRDQTRNTMTLFPSLISEKCRQVYGIKEGAELIRAERGRKRLEAVTSSYRALEGGRSTFVVLNETHHWVTGNNGDKMYETIDGNATKKDSRYLAITNAFLPGEDSVAERMRDTYEKILEGKAADIGFLYDSIEAHPATPLTPDALRIVLPIIRGDAVWLNVETIIQSVLDLTIKPSRSRRMWLNQIVASEDAVYNHAHWDILEDHDLLLRAGDEIVLGFDGGRTDDSTALVAIRVSDKAAFLLGLWEKPDTPELAADWAVPVEQVNSEVALAHRTYKVKGFYADVALWESHIANWTEEYGETYGVRSAEGKAIAWDMRTSLQRSTRAHERLMRAVFDQELSHNGDRALRRHVLNARRRENNYGVSFGKESRESPRKVDAYAALMLAHECLYDLRTRGKKVPQMTGRGYFL